MVTLTLTKEDLKILEMALIELPWKLSNMLINKIKEQLQQQDE